MAPSTSDAAIDAAINGNILLLKKMASKMDLREAKGGPRGRNLLHFAAARGRLEVCKFLVVESGLDVNGTDDDGRTPIALAAAEGKVSVLVYLLVAGGDLVVADADGATPLHRAAEHGALPISLNSCKRGAQRDISSTIIVFDVDCTYVYCPLINLCGSMLCRPPLPGHHEAVRLLLSKGVDVDTFHPRHGSPLHMTIAKDHDQALKVLLEHGADVNRVILHMLTPLVMACWVRSWKCMKLLVEAGADLNFRSPFGPTALMKAAAAGFTDVVKFLLEAGADPNIFYEFGKNAIMVAADKGLRDVVEILFPWTKPIAYVPNWSVDGIIIFMKSEFFNDMDEADAKRQGNKAFAKGEYLSAMYLYTTAMFKHPLDATLLSNRSLCWLRMGDGMKALLDAQNCKMLRPHWSKAWYREGAALSLLKNYEGAANAFAEALKFDPENDELKTALRHMLFLDWRPLRLSRPMLAPNKTTLEQRCYILDIIIGPILIGAAIEGNLRLIKKAAKKVNLREATDALGRNPLHLAAACGHLHVCRFLVEHSGLDVNSASPDGARVPGAPTFYQSTKCSARCH
ncbi:LOW QUALITY PROTEIN: hypothetical protein U9M48_037348 [Paspalum notatum var. saurae]|uniref:Uncharacterized protein n=1 Tax=Paspalum notatum var. saurae TaxID=547442 RepID=A0AAQ3UER0_PASNO